MTRPYIQPADFERIFATREPEALHCEMVKLVGRQEADRARDFGKVLESIWATATRQPATREPSQGLGPTGECQAQGGGE